MISLRIGECDVDILPVVNGLVSEADKVKAAFEGHEAYSASLGIEALQAIKHRHEIGLDNVDVSELDIVYSKKMSIFGEIQAPSPAFCELVDLCSEKGMEVIPLDMSDMDFDAAFVECVKATEFTSVHRMAKKGFSKKMDESSPEALAIAWDKFVSKTKGFGRLDKCREQHIAREIIDTARYRRSLLAVIEVERVEGVVDIIRGTTHA